jgi:hypothetical protein
MCQSGSYVLLALRLSANDGTLLFASKRGCSADIAKQTLGIRKREPQLMKPSIDFKIRHTVKRSEMLVTAIALGSFAPSVFAYLDPSTGSMILSAIVGIMATVGLALKTYWYKLKSLFGSSKSVQSDAAVSSVNTEAASDTESTGS